MADFYCGVAAAIPLPFGYSSIVSASRDGADFTPAGAVNLTANAAAWWAASAEDMAGRVIHLVIAGAGVPNADLVFTTEADYTVARAEEIDAAAAGVSQLNGKITAGQQITVVSPVASDGSITLYRNNSYDPAGIIGRICAIPCPITGNPSQLTGVAYSISLPGLPGAALPAPIIDEVNNVITFSLSLTVDQTNKLYIGTGVFKIVGTIDAEHATDFVHEGVCNVS